MAIVVRCRCGKRYSVKKELLGKRVRCKACERPLLLVPARRRAEAVADDEADRSEDDLFMSSISDAVESERTARAHSRSTSEESDVETNDRQHITDVGHFSQWAKPAILEPEKERFGVPKFVQIAGHVFRIDICLGAALQLFFILAAMIAVFAPLKGGGFGVFFVWLIACVVVLVVTAITVLIAWVFFRMGSGLIYGRRWSVYGFLIFPVGLRTIYFVSHIIWLLGEGNIGIAIFEAILGLGPSLFLYLPATVIALCNFDEFE